jgi:hypothetical protein
MAERNRMRAQTPEGALPILALLSGDAKLTDTVESAARPEWSVVKPTVAQMSSLICQPNLKLVIFDDQVVVPSERGRTLTEIRRCASEASIIYVADEHDPENEKQARSRDVLFYTAKPLNLRRHRPFATTLA